MADLFSSVITAARLMVPGSDSTNMPDATLLSYGNTDYRWLALRDMPRVTRYNGGTFGASSLSVAGTRIVTTTGVNIARLLAVRYEGTSNTGTDGVPLQYLAKPVYELERQTFPSSNGVPRCAYWERIPGGAWTIFLHPATTAVDMYFSTEGEVETADLSAVSSTVLLTPSGVATLRIMLAHRMAVSLGKDAAFLQNLIASVPDRKLMEDWLKSEESRGEMLKGSRA